MSYGGAEIVGPAGNLEEGIALAQNAMPLDCAVLNLNLNGKPGIGMAKDKVGFVFVTGYDAGAVPLEFASGGESPSTASSFAVWSRRRSREFRAGKPGSRCGPIWPGSPAGSPPRVAPAGALLAPPE